MSNRNNTFMKSRRFTFACLLLVGSFAVYSQADPARYGALITAADLEENLRIIASDALEGRETGTRGQKMAAAFISYEFEAMGLKPPVNGSFYQPFALYKSIPGEVYVTVGGSRFSNFQDVIYYGNDYSGGEVTTPVVFVGKSRPQDLEGLDIQGKAVLIMLGADENYREAVARVRAKHAGMVFVQNTSTAGEFLSYAHQFEAFLSGGRLTLSKPQIADKAKGLFFVSPAVAGKIFDTSFDALAAATSPEAKKNALKKIKPGKVTYKTSVEIKTVDSENVLGFLEGSDKKDEVLVITAHYDHIGKKDQGEGDLINNGADDDGSGTVTVLQLAKAFAQAKKEGNGPRRSILFMTVAGEENGLLGSEYYTEHPVFPLEETVVNLNIDMIGRRDEQHHDSPPYVYVIGSDKLSSELHAINESMNEKYTKLVFDYTYNDENHPARLYYRSDHWNFAKRNIPIIFYFDGIHEDYHLPSDEVDKIEFDLLTARAKCVFYTAWELANRDKRIIPDADKLRE